MMEITLHPVSVAIFGIVLVLMLIFLRGVISTDPFTRFFGAIGLFIAVVILWGFALGYHDANYWGEQDRDKYMLTMTLFGVLVILTVIATLALAELQMSHRLIIVWWIAGMLFAVFTVWFLSWILWNDWGAQWIRGEKTATVDVWWFKDVQVSSTIAAMIALMFLGILLFAWILASSRHKVDFRKGMGVHRR